MITLSVPPPYNPKSKFLSDLNLSLFFLSVSLSFIKVSHHVPSPKAKALCARRTLSLHFVCLCIETQYIAQRQINVFVAVCLEKIVTQNQREMKVSVCRYPYQLSPFFEVILKEMSSVTRANLFTS